MIYCISFMQIIKLYHFHAYVLFLIFHFSNLLVNFTTYILIHNKISGIILFISKIMSGKISTKLNTLRRIPMGPLGQFIASYHLVLLSANWQDESQSVELQHKVKVGILRPIQQPWLYWDRSSALLLVGCQHITHRGGCL